MGAFLTKPYAERLRTAIEKSDKQKSAEQAVFVLKQAFEAEILLVEKIRSMAAFRVWIEGERFEDVVIRANKRAR